MPLLILGKSEPTSPTASPVTWSYSLSLLVTQSSSSRRWCMFWKFLTESPSYIELLGPQSIWLSSPMNNQNFIHNKIIRIIHHYKQRHYSINNIDNINVINTITTLMSSTHPKKDPSPFRPHFILIFSLNSRQNQNHLNPISAVKSTHFRYPHPLIHSKFPISRIPGTDLHWPTRALQPLNGPSEVLSPNLQTFHSGISTNTTISQPKENQNSTNSLH